MEPSRRDNSSANFLQRLPVFRPLLFDATMDAQRIYGTHEITLLTRPLVGIKDLL
jgi:hypothetical protein